MEKRNHRYGKGKCYAWLAAHVSHTGDACLKWPFGTGGKGYGTLGHQGKSYWAHRLMCQMAHGDPPTPQHQAAHECNKGHEGCVNPRHLSWKTPRENHMDCAKSGTLVRHRAGPGTLKSPELIAQIISLKGKMSQRRIAEMLGCSQGSVEYWHHERARRGGKTVPILTDDQVRRIRSMRGQQTERELADAMGIHRDAVGRIWRGRSYRRVA